MRNQIMLAVLLALCKTALPVHASDPDSSRIWQKELIGSLNLSQSYFDNWSQGGENAWSWQIDLLPRFKHTGRKWIWTGTGKFSYGQSKISGSGSRKTADECRLESVNAYQLDSTFSACFALTGLTQFTTGYQYHEEGRTTISGFLDPGFFTQSIGLRYTHGNYIQSRLGPALKETVAGDHADLYTDKTATPTVEKVKIEFGVESSTGLNLKLNKIVILSSRLEWFSNFKSLRDVDVDWDNVISAKIDRYIHVNLNIRLFYDKDISPRRQYKQILSAGFSYSFL